MICGMYESPCLTCYMSQNTKQMQFLVFEIMHLLLEIARFPVFWVFYKPFLLLSFPQEKHSSVILGIPHLAFLKDEMSSERNACLHAKNVFSFSYCVPTSFFDNKILFYVLLFCF